MIAVQEQEPAHYVQLRSLLETIVSVISKKTPNPEIDHLPNRALFTLAVNPHDQGRFIGKLGRTIWAIQTIFWYAGMTYGRNPYSVKLLEPDEPLRDRPPVPVKFNKAWDYEKIENLIVAVIKNTLRSYASYSLLRNGDTSMTIKLTIEKYLELCIAEPSFTEAFAIIMRVAGMSQGCNINTEVTFA